MFKPFVESPRSTNYFSASDFSGKEVEKQFELTRVTLARLAFERAQTRAINNFFRFHHRCRKNKILEIKIIIPKF